jgi:predicted PurR-regulated permease PerM
VTPKTNSLSSSNAQKSVTQSELIRAALVVVATLVGLQLLWSARFLVLTAFLGVLLGLAAGQAVDWIQLRVKIKRGIAASFVVFGTVILLVLTAAWAGPTLASQSQELRSKLPEAVTKVELWLGTKYPKLLDAIAPPDSIAKTRGGPLSAPPPTPALNEQTPADGAGTLKAPAPAPRRLMTALGKQSAKLTSLAFGVLQSTLAVFGAIILVIFLSVYIASDPEVYRRGLLLLVPLHRRDRIEELLTTLGKTLKTWFATQLVAMLVIGTITTVVLALIGVRGALPLGVLAGLLEFIPNVGPTLSAIPAILMGFADSPRMALTVVGAYWIIQFLENNLLIPYLMKEQLDLPPALTLVTQVVMAYVFGFLGLFVAIPLLATIVVTVRMLWIEDDIPAVPTLEHAIVRAPVPPAPIAPEGGRTT